MFFIDGHCDTLTAAKAGSCSLYDYDGHLNINFLRSFTAPVQFFAICNEYGSPYYDRTIDCINYYHNELGKHSMYIGSVLSSKDISSNIALQKISAILSIEGGEALEGRLENLRCLYSMGVRAMGLTWNRANELGDSAMQENAAGLRAFGRDVVKAMDELDMLIDVSHLSVEGFWDVYRFSRRPFVASHSNSYSICRHPRNLKDDQIAAIAERKGIIGLNLYPAFLCEYRLAGLEDIIKHAEKILRVGGEDCLGLGCDLDGIDLTPEEIEDVRDLAKVCASLEKYFGKRIAKKIAGQNWLECLISVLPS